MRLILGMLVIFLSIQYCRCAELGELGLWYGQPGWHDITEQRQSKLGSINNSFISRAMYYTKSPLSSDPQTFSNEILTKKRVVLIAIHGTVFLAKKSTIFAEHSNPMFKELKKYAESLGDSVELVSVGWSGNVEHTARENAYKYMKHIFQNLYSNSNKDIFTEINMLGYSHGGNIIAMMTQDDFFDKKINNVITIYTPIRDDYSLKSDVITGKLYHFYSVGDVVQYSGSFRVSDLSHRSLWPWINIPGFQRSSILISRIFSTPPPLLMRDAWPSVRDAALRFLLTGETPFYFSGGRKMAKFGNTVTPAKAYDYRVLVNGESPGHRYIYWILDSLAKIIQLTTQHYTYNSDLVVNIDTQADPKGIYLAIGEEYPPKVASDTDSNTQEELKKEKAFSEAEKTAFKAKYNRAMEERSYFTEV